MSETIRTAGEAQDQKLVELATTIVAPITLITALLAYFGWVRGKSYYGYFGINQGALNLSIQDYLLRSTDVTLGAILHLLTAGVILLVLDRLISAWSKRKPVNGHTRRFRTLPIACGLALIFLGLLSAFGSINGVSLPPVLGSIILGIGAVLALRLSSVILHHRTPFSKNSRIVESVAAIAVLMLAALWTSTLYAQDLGQQTAKTVDASPGKFLPLVTVFSKEFLDLPGSHVKTSKITTQASGIHYRYTGLYLLTYSNDRWFLVTGKYSANHRPSVVTLRDTEAIRVEVTRPATGD